ncbi:S1C family serine protease [Virgibacillus salinus]|uniref:HtrA-like peptidase. Serine peptidase. MEROPS family S01B n=1 Tax=Virgibacillus salinus TaxID=553311 RepID=A0A1H1FX38_9BACI|nr:trypsin-like peptidase domain-containing protein [Virgibacillus salinus]SDR05329.1 htrA-like peptidase. Serine peptidase. MEROPS family S01B [Virgibacillus salinus]
MDRNDNDNNKELEENTLDKQEQKTEANPGIAETARQNAKPKQDKPKQKSGVKTLMSGIAGGVISAVIVALLFTTNIIPLNQQENSNSASSESNEQTAPEIAETVSSDSSNIASNMDEASKAVVGVINKQQQSVWTQSQQAGAGSGIIYKEKDGKAYVVTNQHVVKGAEEVEIVLNKDTRISAKVLGTDSFTDLAVLQIDGKKVNTVADLGSSKNLKVGDTVVAIGNPLGMNFANSVTKGIISGLDRSVSIDTNGDGQPDWITEVIQTDAAINPGNSGGALINSKGEVIGINSMKIAKTSVEGIGFSIPIDEAQPIMKQLEKDGEVARPFIGISTASMGQVPPQYRDQIQLPENVEGGMVVAKVQQGSPASQAELQQFDVITKINGNKITSILDLRKYLYNETKIGESVELEIYRDGEPQKIALELVKREQ